MNLLNLLNIYIKQVPFLLIIMTLYIISTIFIRISKKKISEISTYIMEGMTKILVVSSISSLISVYYYVTNAISFISSLTTITNTNIAGTINPLLSLSAIISLGASIILGIVILWIESKRFILPLKIENENINNLVKNAIKLLNIISFILSIVLVYSISFLAIFPTDMTLINITMIISQVYIYIIIFDIIFSIIAIISNKKLGSMNEWVNYKDLLKNK